MSIDPAPGQMWSIPHEDGWSYLLVAEVRDGRVFLTTDHGDRPEDHPIGDFNGRWMFCGHEGSGVLPAYSTTPVSFGCLTCPPMEAILPLEAHIAPGFGYATITRDGEQIWQGMESDKRLAHFELLARDRPGDWRLHIDAAMRERYYQRQPGGWVLTRIGHGFA